LTKENNELKNELKKVNKDLNEFNEKQEIDMSKLKSDYQKKIDELDKKLKNTESSEVLHQKLTYWKAKAKDESLKNEELEKQIIDYGDKTFMEKIFN
jgi:CII-binding regulator of phage lambda lysogenization HflD